MWTYEEIESLLTKIVSENEGVTMFDIFRSHFNVQPGGNVKRQQVVWFYVTLHIFYRSLKQFFF